MIYELEGVYKDDTGYHESIKIGYSFEPFEVSRKQAYDTHNYGYKFLGEKKGSRDDEGRIQWLFRDDLLRGEWFKDSPEIIFVFDVYSEKLWGEIKSFYSLCREIPVVSLWALILDIEPQGWISFLWSVACELGKRGCYGEKRLYEYVSWVGPGANNQVPTREIMREVLKEVGGTTADKILGFISDVGAIPVDLFSGNFLFTLRSEYNLPFYPRLLKEYCQFLDKYPERDDVRSQPLDPRPKLIYEALGTLECEKENYNIEKLYEKVCNRI